MSPVATTQMSHPNDYPLSVLHDFSNLEVVPQPDDTFKEVHSQPASSQWGNASGQSLVTDKEVVSGSKGPRRFCGFLAKNVCLYLAIALVVVGIVIGVSLGVSPRAKASTTGTTTTAAAVSAASAAPISTATTISSDSGIASVAWNDTSGILQYRVYYQGEDDQIRESAWDASSKTWAVSNHGIGKAKNKSPLAAVVRGPVDQPFQIAVYAVDNRGTIVDWITVQEDVSTNTVFSVGPLSSSKIIPAASSKLAVQWDSIPDCNGCTNALLLVYENVKGQLQIGNFTGHSWHWSTMKANPISGTGLALGIQWQDGAAPEMVLYYQVPDGHLVLTQWDGSGSSWSDNQPLSVIAMNAPLATLTYGYTARGAPLLWGTLSSASSGTTFNWYNGRYNLMGPTKNPNVMHSVQNYTSLATNADAHAFALQGGGLKEFKMDTNADWSLVGDVPTG